MKGIRWILLVLVAALVAFGVAQAATSTRVGWPTACKRVACIDLHLNNLDKRLRAHAVRITALEAQVATLTSENQALSNTVSNLQNQVGCYGTLNVAQYPAGEYTSTGGVVPGLDGGEGGTYIDLEHADNPADNYVFKVVQSYC
jgi:hypothetical protein